MAFGVYIHIPFCIQRCTYCDFATYEQSKIMHPSLYVDLVKQEIRQKAQYYGGRTLDTIYFGGGTPSLIEAPLIVSLIKELANYGYIPGPQCEITIEINPATVDERKLELYLANGINRFSVGAQTFDDSLLKSVHREHSAKQTLQTLELLRKYRLNFSFDILFALPGQKLSGLKNDVAIAMQQGASHISPYCLTVPSGHPLSKGRPPEEEQVDMFNLIANELTTHGFAQYEISNFAQSGKESQHNMLYWTDQDYWGLGLSAHSYLKDSQWGVRYWNLSNINEYQQQIQKHQGQSFSSPVDQLDQSQFESLEKHQAMTDFCHTSLRLMRGLSLADFAEKFGVGAKQIAAQRLDDLVQRKLLFVNGEQRYQLTPEGLLISNFVFEKVAFLDTDL